MSPNPDKEQTPEDMLKIADVCAIMGVKETVVRQLIDSLKLPSYRHSERIVRVKRIDLDNYLSSCKTGVIEVKS